MAAREEAGGQSLDALLEFVKDSRGFDFTGYKRSSIQRRVAKRMGEVGVERYDDYVDYLQLHGDEFPELFNTLLINVTGFFRDMQTWEYMAEEVIPQLLAARPPDSPLRVWSAGGASGEEAYTAAMGLARVIGEENFRNRVKIYATDVDEEALDYARLGAYSPRQVEDVPRDALERFFERTDQRYVFRKDLRRCVIFGRNDLVQDAPISRIDLLICRNTLMYFNADTQAKILNRFHFALVDRGVLFLGKAEMLLSHGGIFTPIDLKRRVFRRVPRVPQQNGTVLMESNPFGGDAVIGLNELRIEAFAASPTAQLVLTADGLVALANGHLERMFGVSSRDIGRPFRDLDLSYRPVELRKYIEQAQLERRTLAVSDVEYLRLGETTYLEIQISPLSSSDGSLLGVNLAFSDVTVPRRLQEELQATNEQLESAYEELQSTN